MKLIQSAAFRLTLWYLGIIMVLSLLFSFALYRVSYDQMAEGVHRQQNSISRIPLPLSLENRRADLTRALDEQLDDTRQSLLLRLASLNLATLLLGGAAAYFLARRTLRPIEEAMEAQGRFTADASHELRTPLTAMRSEIEVALRDKKLTAAEARTLLGSNLEEIAKLEALSAGLLRLARFENGLDASVVLDVPVKDIFESAIDRLQTPLAQRHIELDVVVGEETVAGDQASLTELVVILLDNAIKYSPEKSTIKLRSAAAGQTVRISITDQGSGINASDVPFIFNRFYRADRSRSKDKVEGYGLGLSIAKRIVDLHRGEIGVDSTPAQGSTFKVRLPISQQPVKHPVFG
ncbi:MAG: putative Histidine kinase [Candidatus Saccharibacteria bacterium]|jgi:signal transduction histidine kinase|nr:putative Histidine kinase [Candidatus Saccharibacteria bacterium]